MLETLDASRISWSEREISGAERLAEHMTAGEWGNLAGVLTAYLWGSNPSGPGLCLNHLSLADVHAQWLSLPESKRGPHPAAELVRAWRTRPVGADQVHLIVTREQEKHTPDGGDPLMLARVPGLVGLASLSVVEVVEAVQVDGEPFATAAPGGEERRRYKRVAEPIQMQLLPYPQTLHGQATAGAFLETLAQGRFSGDLRNPIRADVFRLGTLAYALTSSLRLTESQGAILIGGRDTEENRKRFWRALKCCRYMTVTYGEYGAWYSLLNADGEPGGIATLGPPRWWLNQSGPMAWRLSGGLFVPASKWGAVERTIAGLEGALLWGPSAGKGRRGRLPDNVRPVRPGGPGPEVFVPAWQVLRLSGEDVALENMGAGRERYRLRIQALKAAGYFCSRSETAEAGGTVEIVEQRKGGRNHPSGIVIRASARFCAAYADRQETRIPAYRAIQAAEGNQR